MNGIPTVEEFLNAIQQRPGMYWGGGPHPFTSLVAFLAGFQLGYANGQAEQGVSPSALVPSDFHDFVSSRLYGHPTMDVEGWTSMIRERTSSEAEAFQLFFQLRFEYDRKSRSGGA
jgi:hypothetical protein